MKHATIRVIINKRSIQEEKSMNKILADMHTHTIASGHAYATLTEMCKEAANKGLEIYGITEHSSGIPGTCANIYFQNLRVVPRDLFGLDLRLGAEINIIDYNGTLDLDQKYIDRLDFVIAGIHSVCYKFGSKEENTAAIINAIKNPNVNIISHPDDGRCPLDYEALVQAAKEYHVLLEINNNALRDKNRKNVKENQKLIIENCKKYNHPFIMGSDAHFTTDIANYDHCGPLVESMNVDNELIMNYYPDRLREFLRK